MASGSVILSTQSVDYGGGRGHITLTNNIGWSVDSNGYISFWSISSSDNAGGSWGICYGSGPYYVRLVPQVSYDNGASWVTLDTKSHLVNSPCTSPPSVSTYVNTISMSLTLISQLGSYHLDRDCSLRFLYYMDPTPAPSSVNRYAFPNSSYSEAVQVPVHVEVSWQATLNYSANGGSGAPPSQTRTVTNANSTNFTVSDTVPTWEWHRFAGWSTSPDGPVQYQGGDTITISKGQPTVVLYTVWDEWYRVGDVRYSGTYRTTHRSGGKCHIRQNGTWVEMRSIDAGKASPIDPPNRRDGGVWRNQYKIGAS